MLRLSLLLVAALLLCSHDLFLKLDEFFLPANEAVTLRLFNGTYASSENTVARDRMLDVSLVSGGQRTRLDTTQWSDRGTESQLRLTTGAPGTYVVGVSTRARTIALAADKFNDYLAHDGLPEVLAKRARTGALNDDAVESYAKHVKSIFQVGDQTSADWRTVLGYPIEFVPRVNPYALQPGDDMVVQLLVAGSPLPNQAVYLGAPEGADHDHGHDHDHEHDHDHDTAAADAHEHPTTVTLLTDAEGIVRFPVKSAGAHYLRTIRMQESDAADLTHVSNWATLTFGIGANGLTATAEAHGHSHAGDDHTHEHGEEHTHDHGEAHTHADGTTHTHSAEHTHGIPGYAYGIASLLLVGLLFLYFNRRA